jgi:hypothetical protein
MSTSRTSIRRITSDHFEPDEDVDPKVQRQLRGYLEQIDYAAYAANRKVMSAALVGIDAKKFERVALATAGARARWIATGIAASDPSRPVTPGQTEELVRLRSAYEELAEVYEAMRRLVERGYLEYAPA